MFLNCNLFSFVIRYYIGGSALAQGSVFGVAAILPSKHMKAALEGQVSPSINVLQADRIFTFLSL